MKHIRLSLFTALLLSFMSVGNLANAQGETKPTENKFTPAKFSENLNSKRATEKTNITRLEGWVWMSYIVGTDGVPKNIEVIDHSEKGYSLKVSFRFIKNFRYHPAKINGIPVESAKTYLLRHSVAFVGSNNDGISPGFRNRYNEARELLGAQDIIKAKAVLDELAQTNAKNLTEQSLSAWLHSVYFANQKNWSAYGESVQSAHHLRRFLPTKMAIENSQNLRDHQVFKKHYADAIITIYSMRHIKNAELDEATLQAMLKPIKELINAPEPIVLEATLEQDLVWMHGIARDTLSVTFSGGEQGEGEIKVAELRCRNTHHVLTAGKIEQFEIPAHYRGCALILKGTPGTKVVVTETGDMGIMY